MAAATTMSTLAGSSLCPDLCACPPSEVEAGLAALPLWTGDGDYIERIVSAPDFLVGIEILRRVAQLAEDMNHPPRHRRSLAPGALWTDHARMPVASPNSTLRWPAGSTASRPNSKPPSGRAG